LIQIRQDFDLLHPNSKDSLIVVFESDLVPKVLNYAGLSDSDYLRALHRSAVNGSKGLNSNDFFPIIIAFKACQILFKDSSQQIAT
jgi:hypothetical protein